MKMILPASLFCLIMGFLLGRLGQEEVVLPGEQLGVRSDRKVNVRVSPGTSSIEVPAIGDELKRLIAEVESFPKDEQRAANLHALIIQLRKDEIPEALGFLLEKNKREKSQRVSAEMIILLTRWYELEGESVLSWIRGQEEWMEGEISRAEAAMIVDGFHRDPQRGFELALELLDRSRDGDEFGQEWNAKRDFLEEVLYEVGSWGSDPTLML